MELLNRYLHAVGFWLPKASQEDILAELGEDLRSQIEEREAAAGHALDDDAIATILRQRGHPMLVASRYLPQRSLIGPALFPGYQFVLKLVILWILTPIFVLVVGPATILSGGNPGRGLIETGWTLLMAAVFAFGVITLVFAILDRYPHESTLRWDPRRLPRVPKATSSPARPTVYRFTAIVEFLASIAAGIWWVELIWFFQSLEVNGVYMAPTAMWRLFFWPVLLILAGRAAAGLAGWLRPWWPKARLSVRLACDAASLILIGALLNMGPWVRVAAPALPASGVANANHWANVGMSIGLSIASISMLVDTVREARQMVRGKADGGPAPLAVRR